MLCCFAGGRLFLPAEFGRQENPRWKLEESVEVERIMLKSSEPRCYHSLEPDRRPGQQLAVTRALQPPPQWWWAGAKAGCCRAGTGIGME